MKYLVLAEYYEKLYSTSKRLKKTDILAELLRKTNKKLLGDVILLVQGRVFPIWDSRVLGVSDKLVLKVMASSSGRESKEIISLWREIGDLGEVAEKIFTGKKQVTLFSKKLTVEKVFSNLEKLALIEGLSSTEKKLSLISELLGNSSGIEAKYIVRTVLGDLRVGIGEGTLRDAIVLAFLTKTKENTGLVQRAYDFTSDFSKVVEQVLSGKKARIELFTPLKVMLAIKAKDVESVFDNLKKVMIEHKFDGFRIQAHKRGSDVRIFTRRLDNVSKQFPDLIQAIKKVKGDFIIDGEAVGYDPKTKKHLPFQKISQRIKRKFDIELTAKKLPVELNVFDILYLNGESLIDKPFEERRKLIEKIIPKKPGLIQVSTGIITDSVTKAKKFYEDALKEGFEGAMAKNLEAPYKPGARVGHMLKLKSIMETLDLVIVGGEWGKGKRSGWITSYTLACKEGKEVGKVGTGVKEKSEGLTFEELTNLIKPLVQEENGREVKIKPEIIVEVAYEEIQKSPSYSSEYALRFPRILRLRTDKKDVSSIELVRSLYSSQ